MGSLTWVCVCVALCLPCLASSVSLINICQARCRGDEELKERCREERKCKSLLPDLGAFLDCLEPCHDVGTNCFQRCAFKTDRISAICSRLCRVNDARGGPGPLSPGDVSRGMVSTRDFDTDAGTLCYKRCYDNRLNAAMDRVYRKRPGTM